MHNYSKNTTRLQNKYYPDLSENRAVWKSDNQGFKEATVMQMGGVGGDAELQSSIERHRVRNRQSHIHMW